MATKSLSTISLEAAVSKERKVRKELLIVDHAGYHSRNSCSEYVATAKVIGAKTQVAPKIIHSSAMIVPDSTGDISAHMTTRTHELSRVNIEFSAKEARKFGLQRSKSRFNETQRIIQKNDSESSLSIQDLQR